MSKFYPPDPGGLEHAVATLAEGAAARGHRVRVVSATGSGWTGRRGSFDPRVDAAGVEVVRLPTPGVFWSQPLARGYIRAARWLADIVYVHRPHPLADLAVLLGPRRCTVVFHHSDVQRQRLVRAVYGPLARKVAGAAAATVVATRAHLDNAEDLGPRGREKARVIPYGVDGMRFAPGRDLPRPEIFGSAGGPVGLFVGRLVGYKGLDVLLGAVVGTGLRVVIVGDGPLREQLERQIRELDIATQVSLTGTVPEADLPAYYSAADYFVLPSNSPAEMFGISLIEAMACGKPVISTSLPTGVREVNAKDESGLEVAPGDVGELRTAMKRLAGDRELRARLGAAARKRVEDRFTLDRMVDAHLDLCRELVKA
ncbi:MAG: glycosyltransferase [Gemmatimonadales bacterium]